MKSVRIGAGQGFYGDSVRGAEDVLDRGDVQYLCFDALSELTIAILQRDRQHNPQLGYTKDLPHFMRTLLLHAQQKGVRLISNAGGMNPQAAAAAVRAVATEVGLADLRIAVVSGDDLSGRVSDLRERGESLRNLETHQEIEGVASRIVVGVAYFGAEPIVEALRAGAEVVITGRVADASLFLAPMVHELGWEWNDWNKLASGVVLGHLMECSAQSTGGNFSGDWQKIPDMEHIGYPVCEMYADGSAVLTKPPRTGGRVSFDTVKEQLLYEVQDPRRYLNPDVSVDFTTVRLQEDGTDRVKISGVQGQPRPATLKAIFGYDEGWMGAVTLLYSWPQAAEKAAAAARIITGMASAQGLTILEKHTEYLGLNSLHGAAATDIAEPNEVMLRLACRFATSEEAAQFSRIATPLALNGPPFVGGGLIPTPPRPLLGIWPTAISRSSAEATVSIGG